MITTHLVYINCRISEFTSGDFLEENPTGWHPNFIDVLKWEQCFFACQGVAYKGHDLLGGFSMRSQTSHQAHSSTPLLGRLEMEFYNAVASSPSEMAPFEDPEMYIRIVWVLTGVTVSSSWPTRNNILNVLRVKRSVNSPSGKEKYSSN